MTHEESYAEAAVYNAFTDVNTVEIDRNDETHSLKGLQRSLEGRFGGADRRSGFLSGRGRIDLGLKGELLEVCNQRCSKVA